MNMVHPKDARGRCLAALVVWSVVGGAFVGIALTATPVAATPCPPGSAPTWTVTLSCTVTGDLRADYNIVINPGVNLTIESGTLTMLTSQTTLWTITVNGILFLNDATLTTEAKLIDTWLKTDVVVNGGGNFTALDSVLRFPGNFTANPGSDVLLVRTLVTGHTNAVSAGSVGEGRDDDQDDAPVFTFNGAEVYVVDSRIERLYENLETDPGGFGPLGRAPQYNFTVTGSSVLHLFNSYIGIDFGAPVPPLPTTDAFHNVLVVGGSARLYLYGLTIDETQTPSVASDMRPAIEVLPASTSQTYLFRWFVPLAVASNGVPLPGATVWSRYNVPFTPPNGGGTRTSAYYPDSSNGPTNPDSNALEYLGKTVANYNTTGANGKATIPLLTEWINASGSCPANTCYVGNYYVTARYNAPPVYNVAADISFVAYPRISTANNTLTHTFVFTALAPAMPDLSPVSLVVNRIEGPGQDPQCALADADTQLNITVTNEGGGPANDVVVLVSVDLDSNVTANYTIPFLGPGGNDVRTVLWTNPSGGLHFIVVRVDPFGQIQEDEDIDNRRAFGVDVAEAQPDLEVVSVNFSPDPGFVGNPVTVNASIRNNGVANATNVPVRFYLGDPRAAGQLIGQSTIANITLLAVAQTSWVPPSVGSFDIYAWADPLDAVPEDCPFSDNDNINLGTLAVVQAPDLTANPEDLTTANPYPREGGPASPLRLVVRNVGQVDATPTFTVSFYVDGAWFENVTVSTDVPAGGTYSVTTTNTTSFPARGVRSLRAVIDSIPPGVPEGAFGEQNNAVSSTVLVFAPEVTVPCVPTMTIDYDITFDRNVEICGALTIQDATVSLEQSDPQTDRHYIKVLTGGSLTLIRSTIQGAASGDWPIVVYVTGTASFSATDSNLFLNKGASAGILHADGTSTVTLTNARLDGNLLVTGTSATVKALTFTGAVLTFDTNERTSLWDSVLNSSATIRLLTDDGSLATVDLDIRNMTFGVLTSQLRFSGSQRVHFTNVNTAACPSGEDWWRCLIAPGSNAQIDRYWWLTIRAVDATGGLVDNANFTIEHNLNPPAGFANVVPIACGDVYYVPCPVATARFMSVSGQVLYRAWTESKSVLTQLNLPGYNVNATANIGLVPYNSDGNWTEEVLTNTVASVVFSSLTPDLTPTVITYAGPNGGAPVQPFGLPITIFATVDNLGNVPAPGIDVAFYQNSADPSNVLGVDTISVPAGVPTVASVTWSFLATGATPIVVVVDPDNATGERNEDNNVVTSSLTIVAWPDLTASFLTVMGQPVRGGVTTLQVTLRNDGTASAPPAAWVLVTADGTPIGAPQQLTVAHLQALSAGGSTTVQVPWTPTTAGAVTLVATVYANPTNPTGSRDWNPANNATAPTSVVVLSEPDLRLVATEFTLPTCTEGASCVLQVPVHNDFQLDLLDVDIVVYNTTAGGEILGNTTVNLPGSTMTTVSITLDGMPVGSRTLVVYVDPPSPQFPSGNVTEADETNNVAVLTINVAAAQARIEVTPNAGSDNFASGNEQITVQIAVRRVDNGRGVAGVTVTWRVTSPDGSSVATGQVVTGSTGLAEFTFTMPGVARDEIWTVHAEASGIPDGQADLIVRRTQEGFLGLPWLYWIIIIIIIAAAVGGATAYLKFAGLGKLVECGECGAFIPEGSARCPKCGVEFEREMAKCSNCQAWIPVAVKACPECGVAFATGEVEVAEYKERLRASYNEIQRKFRGQAERELGRGLSEQEFQDWWRRQPTFLTFDDWVREDEEMRKMGSKPCPVCSHPNSANARICHKCGHLMGAPVGAPAAAPAVARPPPAARPPAARPPIAPPPGGVPPKPPTAAPPPAGVPPKPAAPPAPPYRPPTAMPPTAPPPAPGGAPPVVVPKKVIKKPAEEREEGTEGQQQ